MNKKLKQKIIEFLIRHKELPHIKGFLKTYESGYLFNERFYFKHYNLPNKEYAYSLLEGMFFESKTYPIVFKENYAGVSTKYLQNRNANFYFKFESFSANGFLIKYDEIKREILLKVGYFSDLIRERNSFYQNFYVTEISKKELTSLLDFVIQTSEKELEELLAKEKTEQDIEKLNHFIKDNDLMNLGKSTLGESLLKIIVFGASLGGVFYLLSKLFG